MITNIQPTSRKNAMEVTSYLQDVVMDGDVYGEPVDVQWIDRVSAQIRWTGVPVGVISVQASNDKAYWVDIPLTRPVNPNASPDYGVIDIETACKYVRIKYTRTSGTGVISVQMFGKSLSR